MAAAKYVGDLARVVARVLGVLVERRRPRRLLRGGVDLDRTDEGTDRREHLARDLADRPVRRERDLPDTPVAVLDDRFVAAQVERDHQRARAVGRRQRQRLPAACAQPQSRVLKLRLRRSERHRQLAQHLRVRVQRVARRAPGLEGKRRPAHRTTATAIGLPYPSRLRSGQMDDPQIHGTIEQLVAEEHELWQRESAGNTSEADRQRLDQVKVSLDQCWDLLRQRRALRDAGRNPDDADVRRPEVVERYEQ